MAQIDPTQIIVAVIAAYGAFIARKAERNSRPVSNGFAKGVRDDLNEIKKELKEIRRESKEDWRYHYDTHHRDGLK